MLAQSATTRTFGFFTLAIGILGFFDNPLVSETGIFHVNTLHNIVHIATGVVALMIGYASPVTRREHYSRNYNMTFGWVYAAVFVLGLFGLLDGLLMVNMADNILHLVFAGTLLGVAYAARTTSPRHAGNI